MFKSLSENSFSGSTGGSPVPSGDSPDGFRPGGRYSPEGTRTTIQIKGDALFARVCSAVPVGGSPTEAGESPALPIFQTGSKLRRQATLLFCCVLAAVLLAGCQATSPSQYISPRVEGRVLDTQTHQPLKGVKVRRVVPHQSVLEARKGGQFMEQTPAISSREDGTFALDSERGLELFRKSSWISVTIAFEQTGYEPFTTNYTLVNATQTPGGEPLVKAGDILLEPRLK